jgi:hypothetical protein
MIQNNQMEFRDLPSTLICYHRMLKWKLKLKNYQAIKITP